MDFLAAILHSMAMRYEVIEPAPEISRTTDDLIVLPNEVVASLDDYHKAKGKAVSDITATRVLAYERPFSADKVKFISSRKARSNSEHSKVYGKTAETLADIVEAEGFNHLFMAGHSAAATESIGVAATGLLPIDNMSLSDPSGVRNSRPVLSTLAYLKFIYLEDKPETEMQTKYDVKVPRREIYRRLFGEIATYSKLWQSDVALRGLGKIAKEQSGLEVHVEFPQYTFTADELTLRGLCKLVPSMRDETGAPFEMNLIEGAYHSDNNNYIRHAETITHHLKLGNGAD